MGLASQDTPFNFPHSVAQYTNQVPKRNAQDQMGRVDGYNPQSGRKEAAFTWTDIYEKEPTSSLPLGSSTNEVVTNESVDQHEGTNSEELISSKPKFRQFICGEEALKISPTEPYCLQRPVRRGHLNISQHYPMQQLLEDLHAIWDCILIEKLHIPHIERNMFDKQSAPLK